MEINLRDGRICLVDDQDCDLSSFVWYASCGLSPKSYAIKFVCRNPVPMHRIVLERIIGRSLVKGEIVDHINGKKFDNRRANLRLANYVLNGANRCAPRHNKSGFKGVSWSTAEKKWKAFIKAGNKNVGLGVFDNPVDAARAYNEAALKHFGEFAWLNPLPEKGDAS